MQVWQIDVVKAAALALVSFAGGYGAFWLRNHEARKQAERKGRDQQEEYEAFKKRRRLVGAGEVERMERAAMLTELLIKQKEHGITLEALEEARARLMGGKPKRTKEETADPAEGVGPNGGAIGYLPNGDKVEWIEDEGGKWPLLLRRNDNDIITAYNERWDKVWWQRHQFLKEEVERGETTVSPDVWEKAEVKAKEIEAKYGIDDLDQGLTGGLARMGEMSALAWVLGAEWEEAADT